MTPWRVLYRGSLKSCNYDCSYCPFAKRRATAAERARDGAELQRFVRWVEHWPEPVAIMFTPWGEALTEPHYREAILRLSHAESVERVVAQTNLSASLSWLRGAERSKVALWATYHPDETTLSRFSRRCAELDQLGVAHSVGVVGKREHLEAARALRATLPESTYLWINAYKSEGPGYYDAATEAAFATLDPLFRQGLEPYASRGHACFAGEDVFSVNGAGDVRRCHFVGEVLGNLYRDGLARLRDLRPCPNDTCRCHIGYVHLKRARSRAQYGARILERIPTTAARRAPAPPTQE